MVVTVIGLGFVGLTSALGFAHLGHKVYGIEINNKRLKTIQNGKLPFMEPGLEDALDKHLNKNFFPVSDIAQAVKDSDVIYFCVGTPYGDNGEADLKYLFSAAEQVLANCHDGKYRVLVTKSTVPPGTTAKRFMPFVQSLGFVPGVDIGIACNPEFLREGYCWDDFINSDRIVIGVSDERAQKILEKLYDGMECPVFCVTPNTAEYIKYLSNTLLATLISYANEMSLVADAFGDIEIAKAFEILHLDKRWGGCGMASYAYPGCGYGGYCLPKDTNALAAAAKKHGFETRILNNVIAVNDRMPYEIAKRIVNTLPDETAAIGLLGLSFKPGSDDVRDAPPAKIIRELNLMGYKNIIAYDPTVNVADFRQVHPDLIYRQTATIEAIIQNSDVIALTTAWPEFLDIHFRTEKPVIDCRFALKRVPA